MFKRFLFFVLMIGIVVLSTCGPAAVAPTATALPPIQSSGAFAQGELGAVRLSTTTIELKNSGIVKSPITVISYVADQFQIVGPICFDQKGFAIGINILDYGGGILHNSSITLSIESRGEVLNCEGILKVRFSKNDHSQEEELSIPVTIIIVD